MPSIMRNILSPLVFRQVTAFGLLGVVGIVINTSLTAVAKELFGSPIAIAYLVGYGTTLLVGFLACRYFIFTSERGAFLHQSSLFFVSSVVFRGIEYAGSLFLYEVVGVHYIAAIFCMAAISFFIKFIYFRYLFSGAKQDKPNAI